MPSDPPSDCCHKSDSGVIERVAEGIAADHSSRANDHKTCLARRRKIHDSARSLQPVDVEQALGKQPRPVDLCEGVEVAEIGDHQASLFAIDREVMRNAVGFARGAIAVQREDRALSDEMHGGGVLVQVGEDRSERLARVQLLRGLRILRVHVHHEMGVRGEQSHLTFGITAIGAVGVGLDKLADGETIRGLLAARWRRVCSSSVFLKPRVWRGFRETPRYRIARILGRRRNI